ncbi:MAG: transcriptional regulator, partial [Myxococcaceae bacterium]|nr:transcriptional regulator [Myxococcaceae bacterium]
MTPTLPLVVLALVVAGIVAHVTSPAARRWVSPAVGALGVLMLAALWYLGLFWAPPEQYMSDVGRILYVHVPHVWMALLAFTLNVGCAVAYLTKKSWVTDALAEAAAEVGVYFGAVGVLMGSIWA